MWWLLLLLLQVQEAPLNWLVRWLLELLLLWWLLLLSPHVPEPANQSQALKLEIFPDVVRDVLELVSQKFLEACSSVCGPYCCCLLEGGIDGSCVVVQLGLQNCWNCQLIIMVEVAAVEVMLALPGLVKALVQLVKSSSASLE